MRHMRFFTAFFGVSLASALALGLAAPSPTAPAPEPPKLRLPDGAAPTGYAVELSIDPAREAFKGSVAIELAFKQKAAFLWLNASHLQVTKAWAIVSDRTVGVTAVPGGDDFVGFRFARPVGPGAVTLHVEYTGVLDESSTQGLFREKDGEDWYAFSMFEATDARRAFPCFDEPAYKVPWQLTLRIPNGTTAVSNTPIQSDSLAADGGRVVRFKKTDPLPSYLVALGVGPFDYLDAGTAGSRKTKIRIVTPRGKASQGRYAAQTTGPLLERLEAYFGIPYPYEKLDHLAVPQAVTFGAEENAGLISWSERALIAPPAEETVSFQRRCASYNAHEMAHQWFGDLVTMEWWNDVWLNESFATWMSDRTIAEWKPEWGTAVERVKDRSNVMYDDTLVSARKIRQEIETADDIVNAFDGISYQKGAAVLTMFEAWIGPPQFQAGVHAYLDAHRFGSATESDFLNAIEKASRPGVGAAFTTFLNQAGVPLVDVALDCGAGEPRLALSQKRLLPRGSTGAGAEVWQIPVCSRGGAAGKDARACTLLTAANGAAPAPALSGACPAWLLANDGEAGYYRALYQGDLLQKLLAVADTELTLPERVGVIRDVNAMAAAGAMPMSDALALVPRFASARPRETVDATLRISADIREHLVPADLQPNYARFVSKMYGARARELGFAGAAGESEDTQLLRSDLVGFVAEEGNEPELQAEARRLALRWLDDHSAVGAEMAGPVLEVAARHGDRALFERFRDAAKTEKGRRDKARLLTALGSFQDPALVKEALAFFLTPDIDSREAYGILFAVGRWEQSRQILWDFVKGNYDAVVARLPREVAGIMPYFGGRFCDAAHRDDVAAFFKDRADKLPGGPRNLAQALEAIDLCTASRAVQEAGVREFLKGY
jgi:alanyl aminopeptidase